MLFQDDLLADTLHQMFSYGSLLLKLPKTPTCEAAAFEHVLYLREGKGTTFREP